MPSFGDIKPSKALFKYVKVSIGSSSKDLQPLPVGKVETFVVDSFPKKAKISYKVVNANLPNSSSSVPCDTTVWVYDENKNLLMKKSYKAGWSGNDTIEVMIAHPGTYRVVLTCKGFDFDKGYIDEYQCEVRFIVKGSSQKPTGECTVYYFVEQTKKYYSPDGKGSKYVVRYEGGDYSKPVIDVTKTVKSVIPNVKYAELTLYLDPMKCVLDGPYDKLPPARKPKQIVDGWIQGFEMQREYCSYNKKYYWMTIPCKLKYQRETGGTEETPEEEYERKLRYFRSSILNYYRGSGKKYVSMWIDEYTPVLGYGAEIDVVTPRVKRVYKPSASKCYLALKFRRLNALDIEGPFSHLPKPRTDKEIVNGWLNGIEKQRVRDREGRYYWFDIPCKLYIDTPPIKESTHQNEEVSIEENVLEFKLINPPIIGSVYVQVNVDGKNYSFYLDHQGETKRLKVKEGSNVTVTASWWFGLIKKHKSFTVEDGLQEFIKGIDVIIGITYSSSES